MLDMNNSGLKYRYILVENPGTDNERVTSQKNARYTVVSDAIKLEKAGVPYEIRTLDSYGEYVRDETGMDQVFNRPGAKPRENQSRKNVELISSMQQLSEASLALAAMERKGTSNFPATNEWASMAMKAFRYAGFDAKTMRELVKNEFPKAEATEFQA